MLVAPKIEMKNLFSLEELPQEVGNKYLAVNIAAKRARQLRDGAIPTVKMGNHKETTVALKEMFRGMLEYQVQPIKEKILVPTESLADTDDDYDFPDTRISDIDGFFKGEEEEDILEVEYVDDSKYYYDDDDEYEEGI